MEIINPNAAGIDIGSRSHFVAINQEHSDVKEFGVYAQDTKELLTWLLDNDVKSVAMENSPRTSRAKKQMYWIVCGSRSYIHSVF